MRFAKATEGRWATERLCKRQMRWKTDEMQGYARCGEGTSNPRKAGQARCVDPSGVCIVECATCQRIRQTVAGAGIPGSSVGGGSVNRVERDAISSQRLSGPISPRPRSSLWARVGKNCTACQRGCLMCWCFVRLESTGTAESLQACLEAGLVTLVTLGVCGVSASSFHMAWLVQLPNCNHDLELHHHQSDMPLFLHSLGAHTTTTTTTTNDNMQAETSN